MPTYMASEWSRSAYSTTRKFRNYVTYNWEPDYSATQSRLTITAAGIIKTSGNQTEIVKGSTSSVKIVCNGVTKTYSTTAKKELDSAAPQYWNLKGTAANYVFYINKTTAQRNITVSVSGGITKPSSWYGTSTGSFTLTQPSSIFYNVTYDANGGTGAPANQIKYNDTALTLSSVIPTKPKYDFLYWNGDDGNTYQPSSVLPASYNDDLALTAEWRESYIAPEFSQMIAYRVDNDATGSNPSVSNSSTRGFVKFVLQRGSGYDLDSISVKFGNNTPQTVPSSQIVVGQTQTTVYAYSNVGDCPSASTTNVEATVYVTDRASVQNTVTNATYISPEKILVDYAHDAIGFGCAATDSPSENGNFDCALDANFTGALLHNGVPIEGGGGTSDYRALTNKPKINSVELSGDKTLDNLGIQSKITSTNKLSTSLINGLSAVATSNSYNDLNDKPTIPSEVTESTVSGWGFTKNTGDYSKPSGGIPKTDLDSSVQTSLGKADTAVQSLNVKFIADTTGVKYSDISTYLYEYDDIIIEIHGARYRFYYKDVDKHYFTSASEVGVRYATVDTSDNWSVTSVVTPTKTNTYSSTSTDVMTGVAVAQALDTVDVPTKTSDLVNDSGFLTEETDPTVPSWAKEPTKPTYTAEEVGALPDDTVIPTKTSELTNDSGFITKNIKVLTSLDGVTYSNIRAYSLNYDEVILNINDIIYRLYGKSGSYYYFVATYFQTLYYYRISSATPWQSGSRTIPTTSSTYSPTSTSAMTGEAVAQALATIDVPTKTSELENDSGFLTESNVMFIADTTGVTYSDITSYVYSYDDIIVEFNGIRHRFYYKDVDKYYFTASTDVGVSYLTVNTSNQWSINSTVIPTKTNTYSATSTDVMTGVAVAQAVSGINVPTKLSELTNDSGFITQNIKVINADSDDISYAAITSYVDEYDEVLLTYDGRTYRYFGIVNTFHYFTANFADTMYFYSVNRFNVSTSGSRPIPSASDNYSATSGKAMTGKAVAEALATIDVPTNVSELNNDAGYITENIKLILDTTGVTFNDITSYVTTYDDIIVEKLGRRYRYYGKVDEQHYYFVTTSDTTLYYIYVSDSNSWGGGTRTVPTISNSYSSSSTSAMSGQAVAQALATISVPTKTSDLTNDSGFLVESDLSDVAFSGDYNDLTNQPTIPSPTTVEQVLTSGTEIAKVNNISLFAPQGGGGTGEVFGGECVSLAGNAGEVTLSTSSANYLTGRCQTWQTTDNYEDVYEVSLNPATITAKKKGMYLVKMSAYFTTNFTINDIIHVNLERQQSGSTTWTTIGFAGYISRVTNASWYERVDCVGYLSLNVGDTIRMTAYNQTGARGKINVNNNTNLQIMQLDAFVSSSDFVVEQGITDEWQWTKWNSGKYEAERCWNIGQATIGNTLTSYAKASNVVEIAQPPHTLVSGYIETNLIGNTSNSGVSLERVGYNQFRLRKDGASAVVVQGVMIGLRVVAGRWK